MLASCYAGPCGRIFRNWEASLLRGSTADQLSAIDDDGLARDERTAGGREHHGYTGNLRWGANTPQGRARLDPGPQPGIPPKRARKIGLDEARGNAIDANIAASPFAGQTFCQRLLGSLRHIVKAKYVRSDQSTNRGNEDDRAVFALRH